MCGGSKKTARAPQPEPAKPDPQLAADSQQREAASQQQVNASRLISTTDSQLPAGSVLGG